MSLYLVTEASLYLVTEVSLYLIAARPPGGSGRHMTRRPLAAQAEVSLYLVTEVSLYLVTEASLHRAPRMHVPGGIVSRSLAAGQVSMQQIHVRLVDGRRVRAVGALLLTYMHTCIHTCMLPCIHAYIRAYTYICT